MALTSKKYKKYKKYKKKGETFVGYIYFDKPRSSQAIEPLSWDPTAKPFQDPSL